MAYIGYIAIFILAYLLGSINSSIVISKIWKKEDIRKLGSGNAGATNTLRNFGIGPTVLVVIGDVLKGVAAIFIGRMLAGNEIGAMLGGLGAVIGHNWPVFFQFKGGKGILTSAAVILTIRPDIGALVVIISILIIAITRYVSLGSLVGSVIFPVIVVIMDFKNIGLLVFSVILGLLAVYRHRGNIKRLREGTESKIGSKK